MKLLFDQNLSFKLAARLADLYPGSSQVGLLGMAEARYRTIWQYAGHHGFVLVSFDADFAEAAALYGPPPQVVWLRCGNRPTNGIEAVLRRAQTHIEALVENPDWACIEIYGPKAD